MDKNKIFVVKNRSAGIVTYRIPEQNIRREFQPGEPKKITFDELEKLSFQPGGREIMASFLQIQGEDATAELGIKTEPEYNMSEQDIINLIQTGEQDAFLDALDFAPTGVIDLIKQFAVSLPMQDSAKREALKVKTGFDVSAALQHMAEEKAEESDDKIVAEKPAERRVKPAIDTGRRTSGDKYKIVTPAEN